MLNVGSGDRLADGAHERIDLRSAIDGGAAPGHLHVGQFVAELRACEFGDFFDRGCPNVHVSPESCADVVGACADDDYDAAEDESGFLGLRDRSEYLVGGAEVDGFADDCGPFVVDLLAGAIPAVDLELLLDANAFRFRVDIQGDVGLAV